MKYNKDTQGAGIKVMWTHATALVMALCLTSLSFAGPGKSDSYYTEPPVYDLRPKSTGEFHLGHVGVTGLVLRGHPGVMLKVQETMPGTPAEGKFQKDEIITGVNGVVFKGRNPFVILGEALTKAEAKDGKLLFDVTSADAKQAKKVGVVIPVLGAYSPTWPLNCKKSKAVINHMADYYSKNISVKPIEGALACLFLLSTGDDQYLPVVKARLNKIANEVSKSDHTWYNGYNGILFCEYYLRTGDASVLPVIQALCDNARDRQLYGIGWRHWGRGGANPQYMDGSLVNAAFGPVVVSLLLAKECPVNVDDSTLQGSLKFFYRFAGHGNIAYGDYRGEGGIFSNGKDGMAAAAMQLACGAKSDVSIYQQARDSFAAIMIDSYPGMLIGHGDWGRSDAVWRGLAASYRLDSNPAEYHTAMNRLAWWYDMSRRPSGGIGAAGLTEGYDKEDSGAGVALGYTAPLKTLRITGAPRSKHAREFTLPANQWGRKADLDFLSTRHGKGYAEEPAHVPYYRFGTAYVAPQVDLATFPREEIIKTVHHRNYTIRTQAAKALKNSMAYDELERLMQDGDRRVRRAALDAVFDCRYSNEFGKNPMPSDKLTPGMLAAIRKMLSDPEEALFVVDGALQALSIAPAKEVMDSLPLILPWTTSDEWWLRHSAFIALTTAARDKANTAKLLPILGDILSRENRPSARNNMLARMGKLAAELKEDGAHHKMVSNVYQNATKETSILPGDRSSEGGFSVAKAVVAALDFDPRNALPIAQALKPRLHELQTRYLKEVSEKLMSVLDGLPESERGKLVDILDAEYRNELILRLRREGVLPGSDAAAPDADPKAAPKDAPDIDTLAALTSLKNENAVWRDIGSPEGIDRVWKYMPFFLKDRAEDKGRGLFTHPVGMEKWFMPEFDDSKWASGKAPIGKGKFRLNPRDKSQLAHVHRSPWGEGEFLMMRTTFEVDSLDYDFVRLSVLANEGFKIHLNGKPLLDSAGGYMGRKTDPYYHTFPLKTNSLRHLKIGKNVIAVYVRSFYEGKNFKGEPIGHFDMRLQGLKTSDLLGAEGK